MSKNKSAKYKITDTNIDKKIIGKQVTVERVKTNTTPTTKPIAKTPVWFVEFEKRNNQRFDRLENRIDRIVKVNNLKE